MAKTFPYAYIRKKTCKTEKAVIPIQSKVVQYGLGFFSGIRGYWNGDNKNIYLFRMEDHFNRMQESAKIMHMRFPLSYPKFKKIVIDLIKKNKAKGDIYIRPTVYAASTELTPRLNNPDDDLAIYMISLKDYFKSNTGVKVCISSWRRVEDDAISMKAKVTGAYANSALAKTEALLNGYDEPIFLNRDGSVCEASGANIFGIKDGQVYTPPLSANNLNGITRRSIIELFEKELNMKVREENFDRSTLYTFDELFFTGTAAKVAWIASVDQRKIGKGTMGKYTKKVKRIFDEITEMKHDKYSQWLTPVY